MKFNTKYRSRIIRGLKKKRKKYQKFPRVITIKLSSINRILALQKKERRLFHSRISFFRHLTSNFEQARGNVSSAFNRLYIGLSKLSLFRVTPLIRNLHKPPPPPPPPPLHTQPACLRKHSETRVSLTITRVFKYFSLRRVSASRRSA